MNKPDISGHAITYQDKPDAERRNFLKMSLIGIVTLLAGAFTMNQAFAESQIQLSDKWDKTFAQSSKVDHKKLLSRIVMASLWLLTCTSRKMPAANKQR